MLSILISHINSSLDQRPFARMSDMESNQIYTRTKLFVYVFLLGLRTEQNF